MLEFFKCKQCEERVCLAFHNGKFMLCQTGIGSYDLEPHTCKKDENNYKQMGE